MPGFEVAVTTPAAAANAAFCDLRTAATRRVWLREVGIFNAAATAAIFSLERTSTVGTATTTVTPVPDDPNDGIAATAVAGTAWSAAPANTGAPMRQLSVPANIGAGVIWTFPPEKLWIPVSASLAIFNRGGAAAGICRAYFAFEE